MSESAATPVFLAVAGVLAADHVLRPQRRHRVEDLLPLEAQRLRLQRGRRLHRDEAEHLEEVGDDHVAEGARFLVEAPPHLDRERLRARRSGRGRCGCGSRPARTSRWRTAARAGSAPPRGRGSGRCGRCSARRRRESSFAFSARAEARSVPKGFSRMIRAPFPSPNVPQPLDRARCGARRQREVEQQLRVRAQLLAGRRDGVGERAVAVPHAGEAQRLGEPLPGLGVEGSAPGAADRLARQLAELLDADLPSGRADDPEALRHQPDLGEAEHPRQQLPLRQVPGRAEEDDDQVLGNPRRRLLRSCACRRNAHTLRLTDGPSA